MMMRDPIEDFPWETDPRAEDDRAHDLAANDFLVFCVHELQKNKPWGHPAALLLSQLAAAYTLQDTRDARDWDPLSTRLFEAVEDLGWGGAIRIIGQALETLA